MHRLTKETVLDYSPNLLGYHTHIHPAEIVVYLSSDEAAVQKEMLRARIVFRPTITTNTTYVIRLILRVPKRRRSVDLE